MARTALPLALLLLAGACARSEDAEVLGDINQVAPVNEVAANVQEANGDVAIGEWRDALQEDAAVLEFGPTGTPPLFSLRCDERRGVLLQRHGAVPTGELPTMLVTVGEESRRLAVTSAGGTVPMLRAALSQPDPFLAALAQAEDPFSVRIGDSAPLVLPPAPQIGTFVAGCAEIEGGVETNAAAPESNAAVEATEGNTAG